MTELVKFQCSSASRKFLNVLHTTGVFPRVACFSALQRAENSSIVYCTQLSKTVWRVSVLFSEPKIPQWRRGLRWQSQPRRVSVLFSEPKIPQFPLRCRFRRAGRAFQCSSASRKFLNTRCAASSFACSGVSVLFSEPKIPQSRCLQRCDCASKSFSALQRAENSSIVSGIVDVIRYGERFSALQRAENSSMSRRSTD